MVANPQMIALHFLEDSLLHEIVNCLGIYSQSLVPVSSSLKAAVKDLVPMAVLVVDKYNMKGILDGALDRQNCFPLFAQLVSKTPSENLIPLPELLHEPRRLFAAVAFGASVYIFGGCVDWEHSEAAFCWFQKPTAAVDRFDFRTFQWVQVAQMPTPRFAAAAVEVMGAVYVIGGVDHDRDRPLDIVEKLEIHTETWSAAPPMLTHRAAMGAVSVSNSIYVIGGLTTWPIGAHFQGSPSAAVERFDTITSEWARLSDAPAPCAWVAVAHTGAAIYVFGGAVDDCSWDDDAWLADPTPAKLDLATGTWKELPAPATALHFGSAIPGCDAIYLFGSNGSLTHFSRPSPHNMKFDTKTNTYWPLPAGNPQIAIGRCCLALGDVMRKPSVESDQHTPRISSTEDTTSDFRSVIEEVTHADPPTWIDEEEAAQIVDLQQAGMIHPMHDQRFALHDEEVAERHVAEQVGECSKINVEGVPCSVLGDVDVAVNDEAAEQDTIRCKVFLLRFGSAPAEGKRAGIKCFRQALLEGAALKQCRDEMTRHGYACELPSGALMFVRADQVLDVQHAIKDMELRHFHIIIAECFQYLVDEVLQAFPFQQRPKRKPGSQGQQELILVHSPDSPDDNVDWVCLEKNTFLCFAPALKPAQTVTQSSTEVAGVPSTTHYNSYKGVNPRRVC